jgi:hypothetical protein
MQLNGLGVRGNGGTVVFGRHGLVALALESLCFSLVLV